jgi:ABC-type uncharacterized transport system substrate-binding protein
MFRIVAVAVGPVDKNVVIDTVEKANARGVRRYIGGLVEGLNRHTIGTDYVIDYMERPLDGLQNAVEKGVKQAEIEKQEVLVFPMSTSALKAAQAIRERKPTVFPSVSDHRDDGIDLGTNATGVSAKRSQNIGKCLDEFKRRVRTLKKVFFLHRPGYRPAERALKIALAAAAGANVTVTAAPVDSPDKIEAVLNDISKQGPQGEVGVLIAPNDMLLGAADMIIEIAGRLSLPTQFPVSDLVDAGHAFAAGHGVSQRKCGKLAGDYVDKIWSGQKPGNLPVKQAED